MIRRLTAREQIIFLMTLLMVVFSFFFNAVLKPMEEKKEILDREIELSQKLLRKDLKIIEEAGIFEDHYDSYLNLFRHSGTEEEAVSAFLSEIETVADRFGLRVMDLKPENVKQNDYGGEFSVSLTIDSELADIIRFLYILQQPPYFFDVSRAEFERLGRGDQSILKTHLILSRIFIHTDLDRDQPKTREMVSLYVNDWEGR